METIVDAQETTLLDNNVDHNNSNGDLTNNSTVLVKGKRTKRPRTLTLDLGSNSEDSPSASVTDEAAMNSTAEEEYMADCLILLAQGGHHRSEFESPSKPENYCTDYIGNIAGAPEKFTSRKFAETVTTTSGKAGFYVYECKTCNKCFPSFQALGGHRASHKKPKISVATTATDSVVLDDNTMQLSMNSFSNATNQSINGLAVAKAKIHECSICGAEFSSGQALGGHMRRHRPLIPHDHHHHDQQMKKEKNSVNLGLDLNLPAPSEDERAVESSQRLSSPGFGFSSKAPMVFSPSASALVDCHY